MIHEKAGIDQDQQYAREMQNTISRGAHLQTSLASNGSMEITNPEGKEVYDKYSAQYSDCQRARTDNMPNECILCIDSLSGKVLEKTISGPGNQNKNYFTPCPCPVKSGTDVINIQKALKCEKLEGTFSIVGTDCSYTYNGAGQNQGHGILMFGDKPALEVINTTLIDCKIPYKGKGRTGKILPSAEAQTREDAAAWVATNYPECKDIDYCMPELNQNVGTMTQDCAKQIYNKYGEVDGSFNPERDINYQKILTDYKNNNNIPISYENELIRLRNSLTV